MSTNQDAKGPFSNFTLNANRATGPNSPTLRGVVTVIDVDGTPVQFEHATWGPNAGAEGKREYYSIAITPKDPSLAARQAQIVNGRLPLPEIPNPAEGLDLDRLGRGVLFETTAEERAAAEKAGKKVRTYFGSALVLLPSGPRVIDLAARKVEGHDFHSGWANHHDPVAAAKARELKAAPPVPVGRRRAPAADNG
jgi:hypothetical protein